MPTNRRDLVRSALTVLLSVGAAFAVVRRAQPPVGITPKVPVLGFDVQRSSEAGDEGKGAYEVKNAWTPWSGEHILWTLGLLPFIVAGLRVYIFAGGDQAIIRALLTNLNVTSLVLYSVILGLPSVFLGLGLAIWIYVMGDTRPVRESGWSLLVGAILIALFVLLTPSGWSAVSLMSMGALVLLLALLGLMIFLRRQGEFKNPLFLIKGVVFAVVVGTAVVSTLKPPASWITAEIITVDSQEPRVGYFLELDDDSAKIYWRHGGLAIVDKSAIDDRVVCTTKTSAPILFLLTGPDATERNVPCPA